MLFPSNVLIGLSFSSTTSSPGVAEKANKTPLASTCKSTRDRKRPDYKEQGEKVPIAQSSMGSPIPLSGGKEEEKEKERETLHETSQKMKMARKKVRTQKNKHEKFPFDSSQASFGTDSSLQSLPINTTRLSSLSPKSQVQTENPPPAFVNPEALLQSDAPIQAEATTYQISDILARAQNIKLLLTNCGTTSTVFQTKPAEVVQSPIISQQQAQARQFLASLRSCNFKSAMSQQHQIEEAIHLISADFAGSSNSSSSTTFLQQF